MPAPPVRRLRSLDVLRGVAILMVFFAHVDPRASPAIDALSGPAAWLFWRVHQLGRTGVELFFVLSGFLIGGLLFDELRATGRVAVGRFWMRRGFKIWPSYYVLLAILGVLGTTGWTEGPTTLEGFGTAVGHVLFVQNYLSDNPNGPTWSLAIEEHFYLFLPVLLIGLARLARRRGREPWAYVPHATAVVVLACLGLRVANRAAGLGPWDFALTHNRMDALMIGVYCRHLVATGSPVVERVLRHRWPALAVTAAVAAWAAVVDRPDPAMFTVGFLAVSIGYALLLLLVYGGLVRRWEEGPALRAVSRVGNWSYNIYLWHVFVPMIPLPGYEPMRDLINAHVAWAPAQIVLQEAWFGGCAVAVGAVATRLVETPLLRLRDRWFPAPARPR